MFWTAATSTAINNYLGLLNGYYAKHTVNMETSMKCVKYLLFAFNLVFAISGLALIVIGGIIQGLYSQYLDFLGDKFFNTPVLLVVVGCLIFIVTFFGCCGAIKEHYCMTMTFSVLLAFIFLLEFGAGIAAYMLRSDVDNIITENMEKALQFYGSEGHDGVTKTWDVVQHELGCCGSEEYKDWKNTTFGTAGNSVPESCCLTDADGCGKGILDDEPEEAAKLIYTVGCKDGFEKLIEGKVAYIGSVGIGIALIQVIGVICACCLARSIRSAYETV